MVCLWCHQEVFENLSWKNIFWPNQPRKICTTCEKRLQIIKGPTCQHCGRICEDLICSDCKWWMKQFKNDPLEKNISVYIYNDFMKDIIAQWKYRGDYVLIEMFKEPFIKTFLNHFQAIAKNALIIPIPLSEERILERKFNQAEALVNLLPLKNNIATNLLQRNHSEKQAKKSRFERLNSDNPFILSKRIKKQVILVDDIYTTGMTLRHAALVLRAQGCPRVYSATLVRG